MCAAVTSNRRPVYAQRGDDPRSLIEEGLLGRAQKCLRLVSYDRELVLHCISHQVPLGHPGLAMLGRIKRVGQAYKASIALSHHEVGHVLHKRLCDDTLDQGTIHTLLS